MIFVISVNNMIVTSIYLIGDCPQLLSCRIVSAPFPAFIATVRLVLQPLANRHGGLFKRAEAIVQAGQQPDRYRNRESHLRDQSGPVHD